jgi:hypothetical protein
LKSSPEELAEKFEEQLEILIPATLNKQGELHMIHTFHSSSQKFIDKLKLPD